MIMTWRHVAYALFVCSCVSACASDFGYRYYNIDPAKDLLLGETPKDDLKLSETCEPDSHDLFKCACFKFDEFARLKLEIKQLRERLKSCQKGRIGS